MEGSIDTMAAIVAATESRGSTAAEKIKICVNAINRDNEVAAESGSISLCQRVMQRKRGLRGFSNVNGSNTTLEPFGLLMNSPLPEQIKAPRFVLGENNRVMNADTNSPATGIAVFGPTASAMQPDEGPVTVQSDESPFAIMKRWSEFRQSPMPKAE